MKDLSRLRILLVEDNALDARAMKRLLRHDAETTFFVEHVESLAAALTSLEAESFDCVLLDLSLPDSHGLLALDQIVGTDVQVPVVVLTGLHDPTTAVEAVNRGAHDYLPKGHVDGALVARSVRYAIARNHSETTLRSATKQLELAHDRERIAQDLHDTVVQQLFATGMSLQSLAGFLDEPHRVALFDAVDNIDVAIRQLREAIFDLHTRQSVDDGVRELELLVAAQSSVLGFHPAFTKRNLHNIPETVLHEARAVIQEAVANVAKHAQATAVSVSVDLDDDQLLVEVTDNGVGTTSTKPHSEADDRTGHGHRNLASRAEALGGTFRVGPGPGGGTTLRWQVPCSLADR